MARVGKRAHAAPNRLSAGIVRPLSIQYRSDASHATHGRPGFNPCQYRQQSWDDPDPNIRRPHSSQNFTPPADPVEERSTL
jgi:hypothetical protein